MKKILNEDVSDLLPKISCPTLLIWGTLDKDTPLTGNLVKWIIDKHKSEKNRISELRDY